MGTGAITQYVDVAQLVLYLFWAFFAGLIYYLVRENHREGYPMETETGTSPTGWPIPSPKTYLMADGSNFTVPNAKRSARPLMAEPSHHWAGAPLVPTSANPMLDGVGPGSWVERADVPDRAPDGSLKIQPLRAVPDYGVSDKDADPRGLPVVGADGEIGGTITDLWLDVGEMLFRFFEVQVVGSGRRVLLPVPFARVRRDEVQVRAILGSQFAQVPGTALPDVVTFLEEEKIGAYYGAGMLYATPERAEPAL